VDAFDDWLDEHVHGRSHLAPARPSGGARLHAHRRARAELRRAAAGVLFLRNKAEAEQHERRARMARVCHAILRAAREDDDETALPLLAYRDLLRERIRAAEQELLGLRTQAADATDSLARLARAIARLEGGRRAPGSRRRGGAG
jgi:hypothetical protein